MEKFDPNIDSLHELYNKLSHICPDTAQEVLVEHELTALEKRGLDSLHPTKQLAIARDLNIALNDLDCD